MSVIRQLLTDHIDIWTAAETEKRSGRGRASSSVASVYGIKKLRELILELAVRGKLVPQDASDEPASELLKRIQNEKANLVAEGKFRTEKNLSPIAEDQKYFELPLGWEWVKLGDVACSQAGFAFKSNGFNETGMGLPLIRIRDVGQTFTGTYFDGEYRDEFVVREGDYLISMDGEFRVSKWLNGKALLNQRVSRLIFLGSETAKRFVVETLQKELRELQGKKSYTTVDHLSGGQISNSVIAFPPLNEQHRIVAKVDELMALCDQLEAQHGDAADAHEQLVSHLLGTLTRSQNAADINANWQRIAAHFDTLFTTEASIDALKQTLLQLAVMGKLVAQDANDEPASELLKRIQAEKAKLIAEGKIKKDKLFAPSAEREKPFSVPRSWKWITLDEISQVGTGATPLRTTFEYYNPPSISWVTSGETSHSFVFETEQYVSSLALKETNLTVYPRGTLIVAMYGQGKTRGQITELMIDACTNQACAAIQLHSNNEHHRKYVKLFFEKIYDEIRELAAGGAQPNLNLSKIKETLLPLPPLSEQHRIVTKVDELMNMCNQLRSSISDANQQQQKLADVLVEQAVMG